MCGNWELKFADDKDTTREWYCFQSLREWEDAAEYAGWYLIRSDGNKNLWIENPDDGKRYRVTVTGTVQGNTLVYVHGTSTEVTPW